MVMFTYKFLYYTCAAINKVLLHILTWKIYLDYYCPRTTHRYQMPLKTTSLLVIFWQQSDLKVKNIVWDTG